MRLSADAVREHIVHPSLLHRSLALEYFADAYSPDPCVMRKAIEALERFGRVQAFRDRQSLGKLAQSRDTLRWLLDELRRPFSDQQPLDAYHLDVANILAHADLNVAAPLVSDITTVLNGFAHGQRVWQERLALASWNAEECWFAIEQYAIDPQCAGDASDWASERVLLVVESLARHGEPVAPRMMRWFGEAAYDAERAAQARILPLMAELTRRMRYLRAIPELASRLGADDDELSSRASTALISLGTDAALRAVLDEFIAGDYRTRVAAAGVMGGIKSELAVDTILAALEHDPHGDVAGCLAHALTRQFATMANRRAREILLRYGGDTLSVQIELIAVCELVGHRSDELETWSSEFDARRSIQSTAAHGGRVRIDPPQSITQPGEVGEERIVRRPN